METLTVNKYGLWIDGQWESSDETMFVLNKFTQSPVAEVAIANKEQIERAVLSAETSLKQAFPPYQRYQVLMKASQLLLEKRNEFAKVLVEEVGKPIREARGEVERAAQTLEISAEEAKRIHGEGIPVEAAPGSENRMAFTIRVPVGVIAAITPFNVPLNLVCHKIGPALASGNSVVLKPAEVTPICALMLAEVFQQAGLPKGRLQIVTGNSSDIGEWLLENKAVRMFTFTGSPRVGELIRRKAGIRKVTLELGNNSATIVHKDGNVQQAAQLVSQKSFNNAGQVCISVQRVYVHEEIYEQFLSQLTSCTQALWY